MDDRILKKLQRKFFYLPVAIGWILIIVACSLVFSVSHTEAMAKVESSLLKANTRPYFDNVHSEKFIYVFYDDTTESVSSRVLLDAFSSDEIVEVENYVITNTSESNKFSSSSGNKYIYDSSVVLENGTWVRKFVVMDYTDTYENLRTLGITLFCVMVLCMLFILAFYYFYAKKAIEPVKQSFERQQELIANASHELKTPITIVRTNLELIGSDPEATVADNMKWLESAEYQVNRMNTLILDMLELTRLESNKSHVEREALIVNDIIEGMMLSFEAPCYEKAIELSYSADKDIKIFASKSEIEKLLGILVDNAIKYTPNNGKITVELKKQRRNAVLTCYNTGEGISQENINNIFRRFFKVDTSHKETANSFGLGLSIAHSIVQSLKGEISCQSELGKYTKFTVELPIYASFSEQYRLSEKA